MGEKYAEQQGKAHGEEKRRILMLTPEQVEGEVQGEDYVLQSFVKDIDQGPRHAHVVKVEKSEVEVQEGETGFEVRH
jgi:hypothetical protein